MNREDIIRMAREAFVARGFWPNEVMWQCWKDAWLAGAAAEREACAKFVEDGYVRQFERPWRQDLAAAIRARGQS